MARLINAIDKPVLIAIGCIVALLVLGSFYSSNFLSVFYLKQQLQISAFLGVIALGAMMVILLGHIDLSVPWVVTMGGMMATSAAEWTAGGSLAIPVALLCGLAVGLVNGFGVAILRIPSMIFTLGVNAVMQGLMVLHTGGAAPLDRATEQMRDLAVGHLLLGIPNAALVWLALASVLAVLLGMTPIGRFIFAAGYRERVAFLSGIDTRFVLIVAFAIAGMCSALAGVLLAGYSHKAYQAMGDPYLLPAIAGVVLGGASVFGGRGTVLGTVVGTMLITLLLSMLSVMQMPDAGRQIIYGVVIIAMMLLYGREARTNH
jgi:ribose transport system permease protein